MKYSPLGPSAGLPSSRVIPKNTSAKHNNTSALFPAGLPNYGKATFSFNTSRLGTPIGKGRHGEVFVARWSPLLSTLVKRLQHGVDVSAPFMGARVVVKVSRGPVNKDSYMVWLYDCMRELYVHQFLASRRCKRFGPDGKYEACVRDFIPPLYAGGVFREKTSEAPVFVIVMGIGDGAHPTQFLTADMYLGFEKAACAMWLHGVLHADLHEQNILWDAVRKRATIIDFGFAIMLPQHLTKAIETSLAAAIDAKARSLGEIFRPKSPFHVPGLLDHSNGVLKGRDYSWYHANSTSLTHMFSRVIDVANLPARRQALWAARANRPTSARRPLTIGQLFKLGRLK